MDVVWNQVVFFKVESQVVVVLLQERTIDELRLMMGDCCTNLNIYNNSEV